MVNENYRKLRQFKVEYYEWNSVKKENAVFDIGLVS